METTTEKEPVPILLREDKARIAVILKNVDAELSTLNALNEHLIVTNPEEYRVAIGDPKESFHALLKQDPKIKKLADTLPIESFIVPEALRPIHVILNKRDVLTFAGIEYSTTKKAWVLNHELLQKECDTCRVYATEPYQIARHNDFNGGSADLLGRDFQAWFERI